MSPLSSSAAFVVFGFAGEHQAKRNLYLKPWQSSFPCIREDMFHYTAHLRWHHSEKRKEKIDETGRRSVE